MKQISNRLIGIGFTKDLKNSDACCQKCSAGK